MKLLIRQGRLVDPVGGIGGIMDVLVEDGKVAVIGSNINEPDARVIDARGLTVCAGLVDMHVHLREPGFEYKETIETGAAAAAHGGFTSIACMPNTRPATDSPEQIAFVKQRAAEACGVHVWPIGAVTRGQQGQELTDFEALKGAGAVALSDDGVPVQNANLMRDGLILAHRQNLTILSHCEDADMVKNYAVNEGRISRQLRLAGRPAIAEELMVARDAMLAEETGGAVHICHISTAKSVALVRRYKRKGVQITCETCPQYFSLTEDEILAQGALARVNPPLRTKADVEAIIEGLKDGTIDAIATDHAPHSEEDKLKGMAGMVGSETAFGVCYTKLCKEEGLPLELLSHLMSTRPAEILGLAKGQLEPGYDADFVLVDLDTPYTVDKNKLHSKSHNCPFDGAQLYGRVCATVKSGELTYQAEE